MLSSISPVGEASRRQRWGVTATAHLGGSLAGGSLVGAIAGVIGWSVSAGSWGRWALVVLGVAAVATAMLDTGRAETRLPSWRRQVDERWLGTYRGWVYGVGYGFQLGAGVLTIVPTALTYSTLLAALLTGSPSLGALVGAVFGAVRAVPLLLTGPVRSPERLRGLHRRLDAARGPVTRTGVGAQWAVGALAILAAIGVPG